jgi:hypothetical protein
MSAYFFTTENRTDRQALIAGVWLTWAIFLRPVCLPLLLLAVGHILFEKKWKSFKLIALFTASFLICEALWVTYNFKKHNTFIPLTSTVYYPKAHNSYQRQLFHFVEATGGSIIWWNPGADVAYYIPTPSFITKKKEVKLPEHAYTSQFNGDSLLLVKNDIAIVLDSTETETRRDSAEKKAQERLTRYTTSIQKEKPFLFYIGSRIRLSASFLFHSGTYNLFAKSSDYLNPLQWITKVIYSLFYLAIITLGLLGMIMICIYPIYKKTGFYIAFTALFLTFIFPIGLQLDEYRYLVPAYPFLLMCALVPIERTFGFISSRTRGYK